MVRAIVTAVPLYGADSASLTLALGDIWFQANLNGNRGPQESRLPHFTTTLGLFVANESAPTIRFDAADAAWMSAYTHLRGGLGELAPAFDPTDQIRWVMGTRRSMQGVGADTRYASGYDMMLGPKSTWPRWPVSLCVSSQTRFAPAPTATMRWR